MQPSVWKGILKNTPARSEWAQKEEALVRTLGFFRQPFFLVECETPDLMAWKGAPLVDTEELALSLEAMPGTDKKRRRKPGNDVIWISPDFDAPLSPEEEELFGL